MRKKLLLRVQKTCKIKTDNGRAVHTALHTVTSTSETYSSLTYHSMSKAKPAKPHLLSTATLT